MEKEKDSDRTNGRFFVQAEVWNRSDGKITGVKVANKVFALKEEQKADIITDPPKQPYIRKHKQIYLVKWLKENNIKVFNLKQFFAAYPMQEKNRYLNSHIAKLLEEDKLVQLSKDTFGVKL